jgi:hypothetical protein
LAVDWLVRRDIELSLIEPATKSHLLAFADTCNGVAASLKDAALTSVTWIRRMRGSGETRRCASGSASQVHRLRLTQYRDQSAQGLHQEVALTSQAQAEATPLPTESQ